MTGPDAEALIKQKANLCARLYRRADGTVLTGDCPVGLGIENPRVRRRVGWAVAGALSVATAWGQGSAALSGKVTDLSGSPAPPTTITIIDSKTGTSRETKTEADGKFKLSSLQAGTYGVIAASPGFAPSYRGPVRLHSMRETKLNVTIMPPFMGEVVEAKPKPWWRRLL
jgi:hypothetical protein